MSQTPRRTAEHNPAPSNPAVCLTLLLAAGIACADQRADFLMAESALGRGDQQAFEELTLGLHDYPLAPYLRFEEMHSNLDRASPTEVERFLAEHEDTPLAGRLRRAWLKRLAAQSEWKDYVRLYRPDDSTEQRCHYLYGLIATGRSAEALHQVEPLWLVGRSQPNACDPVLDAWRDAGGLTTELVWARVGLAMDADQTALARHLRGFLPVDEQVWLERWFDIRSDPERIVDLVHFTDPHPQREHMLAYGIERLTLYSPQRAAETLDLVECRGDLSGDLARRAAAAVGFALTRSDDTDGLEYLDWVRAGADNIPLQERRLRAALTFTDWARVTAWVAAMPPGQHKAEHWLYWQARAEETRGNREQALVLYREAAAERSLWGFLAAERIGDPYHFESRPTPADPERIERIELGPAVQRIRELRALGRDLDMRREWYHLTRDLDAEDLQAAAVVASRWGSPDQAIFTLAKSGYWDDLELRFPLLYWDEVAEQASATGLDASWIFAVLRQESAFNPKAVSHAGAVGLMQLMPATARSVASSLDAPRPSRSDLFDPRRNITLGSTYLADMQDRFDGNPVLAAAAYNAGPQRVDKWLPAEPVDADVWVATIPFHETRGYVRRVLAYRVIYDYRLGRTIRRLSELMRSIGPGTKPGTSDTPLALTP